jgi:hypothetical protein
LADVAEWGARQIELDLRLEGCDLCIVVLGSSQFQSALSSCNCFRKSPGLGIGRRKGPEDRRIPAPGKTLGLLGQFDRPSAIAD